MLKNLNFSHWFLSLELDRSLRQRSRHDRYFHCLQLVRSSWNFTFSMTSLLMTIHWLPAGNCSHLSLTDILTRHCLRTSRFSSHTSTFFNTSSAFLNSSVFPLSFYCNDASDDMFVFLTFKGLHLTSYWGKKIQFYLLLACTPPLISAAFSATAAAHTTFSEESESVAQPSQCLQAAS